jgi:hypothetical protein
MTAVQEEFRMREVQGVIFFADQRSLTSSRWMACLSTCSLSGPPPSTNVCPICSEFNSIAAAVVQHDALGPTAGARSGPVSRIAPPEIDPLDNVRAAKCQQVADVLGILQEEELDGVLPELAVNGGKQLFRGDRAIHGDFLMPSHFTTQLPSSVSSTSAAVWNVCLAISSAVGRSVGT